MKNKKILSIILTVAMLVSMFSVGVGSVSVLAANGIALSGSRLTIKFEATSQDVLEVADSFSENELSSVTKLNLNYANLTNTGITNEALAYLVNKLPNVTELFCVNNSTLSSLKFIEGIQSLTLIQAPNCYISNISPISKCHNLTKVVFNDNYITDITPIFEAGNITYASLSNNRITNITGLKEYFEEKRTKVEFFDISNNPLSDQLDYIESFRNYAKLDYKSLTDGSGGYVTIEETDFKPLIYDKVSVDNETKTITINSRMGANYVAIYDFSADNSKSLYSKSVSGLVDKYTTYRYKFSKPLNSDTLITQLVVGDKGKIMNLYTLVINFIEEAKPTFEADKLTIKNATNTSFDAENSALTIDSEGTYVRVYKTLVNGATVKVNADDYDFITEYDNFYHINKLALKTSDLNIASFEMTTDSGDTISTKVNFPNAGILPLEKFKITNYDSLTIDGNEINIDIVDTKTYSRIFKTVSDGTTLTIESDNVYVEEREDCYVLRQRAVGATITMTYGENTYTINLTK